MIATIISWIVDFTLGSGVVGNIIGIGGGVAGGVLGFFTKGWLRWLALGVAIAAVAFWIMGLKLTIAHQETAIATLQGEAKVLERDKNRALDANASLTTQIREITEDRDAQAKRAEQAGAALAKARTTINANTLEIIREADHAATPEDDAPVPPGLRATLRELRERYGRADGH